MTASWQVTPDDSTCNWDLLNEAGEVIVSGVADTADGDPSRRGMAADYDPANPDALGAMTIRCSRLGGDQAVVEQPVHRVTYDNRHPDSVLPATDEYYFDHDEVASLFGECGPARRPRTGDYVEQYNGDGVILETEWLDLGLDFWQHEVFENWDAETHEVNGIPVASGWWTTEQLRLFYPESTITAEEARDEAFYRADIDLLWLLATTRPFEEHRLGRQWLVDAQKGNGFYYLKNLYLRLNESVGYVSLHGSPAGWGTTARWIRDASIGGTEPNPEIVSPGALLYDWMDARYRYAPIDREPTAWAMRTLLEARNSNCVARLMREHCDSGEFHESPHMRHPSQGGSRLGSILWSAVCPEVTPGAP